MLTHRPTQLLDQQAYQVTDGDITAKNHQILSKTK